MGGTRIQVQDLFSDVQQLRQHCRQGGEEDGCVCHSRPVPNQDTNKASYQSRSQGHIWQGDEGQSQASQDRCEGLPRGCAEEADLKIIFGKEMKVKAKPAKTVVKVFPAAALKKQI